jgi:exodeoxyribonuclease VII large subunit
VFYTLGVRPLDFQRRIYTVSELSAEIREMLDRRFTDIWIEGEISNFKSSSAGHLYFTLKDDRAQLPAVCFRNAARLLRFKPENGKLFRARGRITAYEGRGEYQIIVEVLEPAGLGALQLAFEQLKEKLEKEGLFRVERKRLLPAFPRRIGIVTSPAGAAIRDVLTVLKRRHDGLSVLIYPSEVQGPNASFQIVEGIDYLSNRPDIDVILVTRGGGSMEDLWPFNEERVARAIVRSPKPVISAVGHEVDFTIADFVSDLRAPTPSAAAELVIQSKEALSQRVRQLDSHLLGGMRLRLSTLRHFLATKVGSRGFVVAEAQVRRLSQRVDDLSFRLLRLGESGALLQFRSRRLSELRARLDRIAQSGSIVRSRAHGVNICEHKLTSCMQHQLRKLRQNFAGSAAKLDALSPLAVLDRGYAVCQTPEGHVVRSANDVELKSAIQVRLHRGTLFAEITAKNST